VRIERLLIPDFEMVGYLERVIFKLLKAGFDLSQGVFGRIDFKLGDIEQNLDAGELRQGAIAFLAKVLCLDYPSS